MDFHIGIDIGGTKILGAALTADGNALLTIRRPTPRFNYDQTISTILEIVTLIEDELQACAPVGICIPGSVSPATVLIQNANSTCLHDKAFKEDLECALKRPLRLENDANYFDLSECVDGAGQGAKSVFGVIMGTGVGGGLIFEGQIVTGPRSIGGEWGHCSLPYPTYDEIETADQCWCGQKGCIESWISGPGLLKHHNKSHSTSLNSVEELVLLAQANNDAALASLKLHTSRTARALSMVVNIIDPEVIVLGGGLSEMDHLYDELPHLMKPTIFSHDKRVDIRRPLYGPTSGVRGAARLWDF